MVFPVLAERTWERTGRRSAVQGLKMRSGTNGNRTLSEFRKIGLFRPFFRAPVLATETMLEGNISSLLSSTLSKVFEEKCLTKDNIQTDLYNGCLCVEMVLWVRTDPLFQLGSQEEHFGQSFCPDRLDPRRRSIAGREDYDILHLLQRSSETHRMSLRFGCSPRRRICASLWSRSTTTPSITRYATIMYGCRFRVTLRMQSCPRFRWSKCVVSCRRRFSRRRRAVMMRAAT